MSDGHGLEAHLFICTNTKESGESCAPKGSVELRDRVKKICQSPEWHGRVRVNASGCLGRCKSGITAVLYPEGRWFEHLHSGDVEPLRQAVSDALDSIKKT